MLKLQYFGSLIWRAESSQKALVLERSQGKVYYSIETGAAKDEVVRQHHPLNGHESEQTLGGTGGQEPGMLQSLGMQSQRYLATEQVTLWLALSFTLASGLLQGNSL